MSCDCCCPPPVGIRVHTRSGSGTAHACAVAEHDGDSYTSVVETHTHENDSFTVTISVTPDVIVNGEGACDDTEIVSTRDDELDYGTEVEVTYDYSDAVDLAAVLAAARAGIVYGDSMDTGRHLLARGQAWFSDSAAFPGPSASGTQGEDSAATSTQTRYVLELYSALDVSLIIQYRRTSDATLTTRETVMLTSAAPDSGWITAPTPDPDDGVEVAWIAIRIPPYTTLSPPLP